jgi:hypothetical protein
MDGDDAEDILSQALEYRRILRWELNFNSTWEQEWEATGQSGGQGAQGCGAVAGGTGGLGAQRRGAAVGGASGQGAQGRCVVAGGVVVQQISVSVLLTPAFPSSIDSDAAASVLVTSPRSSALHQTPCLLGSVLLLLLLPT